MPRLERPLPIIGVVHLLPLPGSPIGPRPMREVLDRARQDAIHYLRSGADAVLVENHGDAPFDKDRAAPHVPAALAVVAHELRSELRAPVGVNVLRNDVAAALGAAVASGAGFVRANVLCGVTATDQGLIEGRAAEWLRYRRLLGAEIEVWADVDVKYGTPLHAPGLGAAARMTAGRGGADRLLVTGRETGAPPDPASLEAVKEAVGSVPVLVASGLDAANAGDLLPRCDGAIVGSSLKEDSDPARPVDPLRVTALMNRVRSIRRELGFPP